MNGKLIRSLKIGETTMNRLVRTLHMGDEIEEERIDRRKVILTLKKAD